MSPAMNIYAASMNPIGTPAVRTTPTHDLYLSIMQLDEAKVGLRAFINPAIAWLWIGAGVMMLGCALAVAPGRRKALSPALADPIAPAAPKEAT